MFMKCKIKKSRLIKSNFTLVEAIVALAVMGISVAVLLEISGDALSRMAKADSSYEQQHALTQAVEYYSLANIRTPIDQRIFNLDRFDINVNLLHSDLNNINLIQKWKLKNLVIKITDKKNKNKKKTAKLNIIVPANKR